MEELSNDYLYKNILDFSIENEMRLNLFLKFYSQNINNDSIELLYRITGIYQFTGSKVLENFLYLFIKSSNISEIFKLEAVKSLLLYCEVEPLPEKNETEEEKKIREYNTEELRIRNIKRIESAYNALDYICTLFDKSDISIPCQIDAIFILMKSQKHKENANLYFKNIINNENIDCDFRYKTILSLEKQDIEEYKFFMHNACLEFLKNPKNKTMYRILSSQYLLQNYSENIDDIQDIILSFANDNDLDYNLRADAADTLLNLGSEKYKKDARDIIICLGKVGGNVKTVFENAQNVHTSEIEKSVSEILQVIIITPIIKIDDKYIDITYIEDIISKFLKEKKCKNTCVNNENINEKEKFCSKECEINVNKENKINISLNRIKMDRTLYSNSTLLNIFIKLWCYIHLSEFKDEMMKRLFEELEDMSGTCSSGFLSRLVNVVSGFDENLSIRISWQDQIISNFVARLNSLAQKILERNSPFYNQKLNDVIELFINENQKIKKHIISNINDKSTENIKMSIIIEEFLKTHKETKIQHCVEIFSENVLNEMMIDCHKYSKRQNFLLFFRTYISSIREELFEEFKNYVTPSEFDLHMRKAISSYEGVNFML
jgi:hypothetical protein